MPYLNPKATEEELFSAENEHSTLFILGNGFDLDLKLPTSYADFIKSDYFPFVYGDCFINRLGRFIFKKGILQKWYDLEHLLAEYGQSVSYLTDEEYEGDKNDFRRLIEGLEKYLNSLEYKTIDEQSVAARLLKAADDELVPPRVYSFNYTRFDTIADRLGLSFSTASHVHGCLEENNVVLGVGEYARLGAFSSYLYKTSNINYNSGDFLTAIEHYDTVIIFGLSLSPVDYPYFEDFFKTASLKKDGGNSKPFIRVVTYDEKSRTSILDNLRQMNSGLIKLMGYTDFDIIRTKDAIDEDKVSQVIHRLSARWDVETT